MDGLIRIMLFMELYAKEYSSIESYSVIKAM